MKFLILFLTISLSFNAEAKFLFKVLGLRNYTHTKERSDEDLLNRFYNKTKKDTDAAYLKMHWEPPTEFKLSVDSVNTKAEQVYISSEMFIYFPRKAFVGDFPNYRGLFLHTNSYGDSRKELHIDDSMANRMFSWSYNQEFRRTKEPHAKSKVIEYVLLEREEDDLKIEKSMHYLFKHINARHFAMRKNFYVPMMSIPEKIEDKEKKKSEEVKAPTKKRPPLSLKLSRRKSQTSAEKEKNQFRDLYNIEKEYIQFVKNLLPDYKEVCEDKVEEFQAFCKTFDPSIEEFIPVEFDREYRRSPKLFHIKRDHDQYLEKLKLVNVKINKYLKILQKYKKAWLSHRWRFFVQARVRIQFKASVRGFWVKDSESYVAEFDANFMDLFQTGQLSKHPIIVSKLKDDKLKNKFGKIFFTIGNAISNGDENEMKALTDVITDEKCKLERAEKRLAARKLEDQSLEELQGDYDDDAWDAFQCRNNLMNRQPEIDEIIDRLLDPEF